MHGKRETNMNTSASSNVLSRRSRLLDASLRVRIIQKCIVENRHSLVRSLEAAEKPFDVTSSLCSQVLHEEADQRLRHLPEARRVIHAAAVQHGRRQ